MILQAIQNKLGVKQGITIIGDKITEWPYEVEQPDDATLQDWVNEYEAASFSKSLTALPKQLRKATTETTITVDGVEYECNMDTVMTLLGLIRLLEELNDPTQEVQYKGANGFYGRTLSQLKVAGIQVGLYINTAFVAEKVTNEEVANGTITTEEQLKARFTELMEDYEK